MSNFPNILVVLFALIRNLKNNNIPTIYFNAWENDFSNDALVSLLGEMGSALSELSKTGNESKIKEYFEVVKTLGIGLMKRSVPVAAKVATAGALDLDRFTEQAIASLSESIAKEQIEKYERSKETIQSFRDALKDLAKKLSAEEQKPLVFIIDELDRCRPNYSVEVLEKAKHFFNVDNIVFVLGADKVQLGSAIKAVYGDGLDVNGYLRRFIDFDYLLPPAKKGEYIKLLFDKFHFTEYFSNKKGGWLQHEQEQALQMFEDLFYIFNLTLREQEHCCSLLSIAIRTTPINIDLHPLILCYLIVVKVKDPDSYKRILSGNIQPKELIDTLCHDAFGKEFLDSSYGVALEAYIVTSVVHWRRGDEIIHEYQKLCESGAADENEKSRLVRIIQIIRGSGFVTGKRLLENLVSKIEMSSRFETQ